MNDRAVETPPDESNAEADGYPPAESLYEFVETNDQRLRCFIVETMASADIDGRVLVENMDHAFKWIKEGVVPTQPVTSKTKRIALNAA